MVTATNSIQDVVLIIIDGISDNNERRKVDDNQIQDDVNDGGEMNVDLWLKICNVSLKSLLLRC